MEPTDHSLQQRRLRSHLDLLLEGDHVLVHLNPRFPGVLLPESLRGQQMTTLKLSRLFSGKLSLTSEEIRANLRFESGYFECVIPYLSIIAITDHQGKSDVTQLVHSQITNEGLENEKENGDSESPKTESSVDSQEQSQESGNNSEKSSRPTLKRIK